MEVLAWFSFKRKQRSNLLCLFQEDQRVFHFWFEVCGLFSILRCDELKTIKKKTKLNYLFLSFAQIMSMPLHCYELLPIGRGCLQSRHEKDLDNVDTWVATKTWTDHAHDTWYLSNVQYRYLRCSWGRKHVGERGGKWLLCIMMAQRHCPSELLQGCVSQRNKLGFNSARLSAVHLIVNYICNYSQLR